MEPKIIYEDESLMVLDKPAGWVVDEVSSSGNSPVIQTWLGQNFQYPISNTASLRSGVVHRLDKETSGLLLIAKTRETRELLQQQFKERRICKEYLALVHGKLVPKEGQIKVPVGRTPWNRQRFGIMPGGRESESNYKVLDYYQKKIQPLTLVSIKPKTGRTHQIRIHLKYLNHPVVSDSFYAGRKVARADRLWCPRLFLHAKKIKFTHPLTKKEVEFKSELPQDLTTVLKNLKRIS